MKSISLTRSSWSLFFLLLSIFSVSLAQAAGGDAYTARAENLGPGISVNVGDLMAEEAKAAPSRLPQDMQPTKPRFPAKAERRERRRNAPSAEGAPLVSAFPDDSVDDARGPMPNTPQTVGVSVLGISSGEAGGFVPPDSHGAVGDSQMIVVSNVFIRSFNKTTGAADGVLALSLQTLFSSVSNGQGLSDPRIKFDPLSRRWFLSIINVDTTQANRILLAVSSSATITSLSSFTLFQFQATAGGGAESQTPFADYPTLGIDRNGVYLGLNMFNLAGTAFIGSTLFVLNKANLIAPAPALTVTAFRQLNNGSGAGAYTPYVGDNDDPAATSAYLVGVDAQAFSLMVIRRITGAGTLAPTISANFNVTVPMTTAPLNVTVQGRSQAALDALDDRLFEAKVQNGRLWTAHNFQVNAAGVASGTGGRTGSRWYEFGTLDTTPTLVQSGTLFDSAASSASSYWIPSIGVTGQGHAALGSSRAGPAEFPNIAYAGRLSGDTAGTLRAPTLAHASVNSYTATANRWGDYSHTATDPNDNMTLWTFQEYAPSTTTWGVRAIQLRAPAPATVSGVSPSSVTQGQTLNVTVTGTSVAGSGFYNPPAAYPNRLQANFGAGVSVNSVVSSTPTSATFNVSVGGSAAVGARSVTVTNPDGQASTANGLFTVAVGSCPNVVTVSPTSLPNAALGVPYSQTLSASPAGSYTFSSSGTLPSGVLLSGNVLSGTPTASGSFNFTIIATDGSGCSGTQAFTVNVGEVTLAYTSTTIVGDNNRLDPNDCNALTVRITNNGGAPASAVSAVLTSATPGVTITQPNSPYPNINGAATGDNTTAFQVSTANTMTQGSTANFTLTVNLTGGASPQVLNFSLPVGVTPNYAFTSASGAVIPNTGTLVAGSQADDAVVDLTVPAGFNFSVYGTNVTGGSTLRVSTNGNLQLVAAGGSSRIGNSALPSLGNASFGTGAFDATTPVLMPYWDDLDLRTNAFPSGGIYSHALTGSAPNRQWIVQWRGQHFDDTGTAETLNFGIRFNEGSSSYSYLYALTGVIQASGASATVGAQAATSGTLFTQYSLNQAVITPAGLILNAALGSASAGPGVCAVNAAPTITAVTGLSRQQGSPVANSVIANVTDDAGNGSVTVTGASTVNGITLSNIVNAKGSISGDLVASCSATNAAFTLTATDAGSLTATSTLNVAAAANTPPAQGSYANTVLTAGGGTTVTPTAVPSDNGAVSSVTVAAPGFSGTINVNPSGVVTIANAGPAAVYTVTVTATDNCNATSTSSFQLTVNPANTAPTIIPVAGVSVSRGTTAGRAIATVSDSEQPAGSLVVTGVSFPAGLSFTGPTSNFEGNISAAIATSCTAALGPNTVGLSVTDGSLSSTADLTVTVTDNTPPVQGTYANASIGVGAGTTATPSFGPGDNGGSITSVTVAATPLFSGTLSVASNGVVTIGNAGPAGVYTITVTATDSCGASSTSSFQLTVNAANAAPTITAATGLGRQQGSPVSNATIATVTDDGGAGTVVVTGASTVNGITLSNIVNTGGTVTGDLIASCSASNAAFTLTAADAGTLTATSTLNVNVIANAPPVLGSYANTVLTAGGSTTVTPSAAPSDNGSITSVTVSAPGLSTAPTVNPSSGVVSITNAGPPAVYTVTVTAADNCFVNPTRAPTGNPVTSTSSFQLTVNPSGGGDPVITPVAVTRAQGSANFRSVIANVSNAGGAGNVTVTAAVTTGSGVVISGIQNNNGVISALIRAGCTATSSTFSLTANNGSSSNVATLPVTVTPGSNPIWCQWWPR